MTRWLLLLWCCLLPGFESSLAAQQAADSGKPKLVLAHYMPWFAAKPARAAWGWHWTMNFFDPDVQVDGRRQIASHYYPLIGPYDSGDPAVLECQLLQMKTAGIDGVIVDWYGLTDYRDYSQLHQNTLALVNAVQQVGMKFVICYEDQTIPALVGAGRLADDKRVAHAVGEIDWLQAHWFGLDSYVRLNGRPVLLSFGQSGLSEDDWGQVMRQLNQPVEYFSQHHRRDCAAGAFDWPDPGPKAGWAATQRFNETARTWPASIPVAYPRFVDIYSEAGVRPSWGQLEDQDGGTFRQTLTAALASQAPLIQIATWNDWGEGTIVEPSRDFGYRDLETIQQAQRDARGRSFSANGMDLRLPRALLQLRRQQTGADRTKELDAIAKLIAEGHYAEARDALQAAATGVTEYRQVLDIPYRDGKDLTESMRTRCRLDVYYPVGARDFPTVVWFHGGGLTSGNKFIPEALKQQGIAVVAVNYRLFPEAKSPAYIEDAAAAVAWTFANMESYGGSPGRIFVAGHSAGGYLASMVGLDKRWLAANGVDADRIAGLVPYSGHSITHMTVRKERGIDNTTAIIDDLAPVYHARSDAPPMLLVTGDRDLEMLGRYEETAYFWRMLKLNGHGQVQLIELKGYDHGQMAVPTHPYLLQFIRDTTAIE